MTLEEALLEFVRLVNARAIPYMVIGGFAALQWAPPRTTLDLDVTADASDERLVELAREAGEVLVEDPAEFLGRARVLPLRLRDGTRVDLVAATLPFEIDSIHRARTVRIGEEEVRVCAPEDLIIHKIVSDRARDLDDVRGILQLQGNALDLDRLDRDVEAIAKGLERPEILERYRVARREATP